MSVHDPLLPRRSTTKGLLDWLRFGEPEDPVQDTVAQDDVAPPELEETPRRAARRELLGDITAFLMAHDLEVNSFTLSVAYDYLGGDNTRLHRSIDQRLKDRHPLTQPWLETATHNGQKDQAEALHRMMERMEADIDSFGSVAKDATSVTSHYNKALAAHVDDLDRAETPPVEALLATARAMLDRTRVLEQDMLRSEAQTKALRRSLDQARRRADHDHLTGLPNRRAFESRFEREHAAAKAKGEQLSIAFVDIDHFKRINDQHGHDAGDRVLKTVAETLSHISDDRCHVARHGGEEFVVLLRGRSIHEAWEVLDETRQLMASRKMVNRANDTPFGQVTFSAGIADVFAFDDPRAALGAADKALYRAKDQGRNRVVLAERPTKD